MRSQSLAAAVNWRWTRRSLCFKRYEADISQDAEYRSRVKRLGGLSDRSADRSGSAPLLCRFHQADRSRA